MQPSPVIHSTHSWLVAGVVGVRWSKNHNRPAAVATGEVVTFDYSAGKVAPMPSIIKEAIAALEDEDSFDLEDELQQWTQHNTAVSHRKS